jgi:glycine betaine/proline transport system substrate-binding protein
MMGFYGKTAGLMAAAGLSAAGLFVLVLTGGSPSVRAAEPASCSTVKLAEVGWTDVTLTTNVAMEVLKGLGYKPVNSLYSLEILLQGMADNKIDVFLGDWRPSVDPYTDPYFAKNSLDRISTNLDGAKFTLAVPKYVADAGVHSFADLAKYSDKFGHKIYGIEPGSNESSLKMVAKNEFGLGDWKVVESSEQGMLAAVSKAYPKKNWIVFQGWAPHPMNVDYDLVYLAGGDDVFGPNFGGATVTTLTRKGYAQACPNVATLLKNMKFDLAFENVGMKRILSDDKQPDKVARQMVLDNPTVLTAWLKGVTTIDGKDGLAAVKDYLGIKQ